MELRVLPTAHPIEDTFDDGSDPRLLLQAKQPSAEAVRVAELRTQSSALDEAVHLYQVALGTKHRARIDAAYEAMGETFDAQGLPLSNERRLLFHQIEKDAPAQRQARICGVVQNQVAITGDEIYRLSDRDNPYLKAEHARNAVTKNRTPGR